VVSLEVTAPLGPGETTPYAPLGYWFGRLCVAFSAFAALSLANPSGKSSTGHT